MYADSQKIFTSKHNLPIISIKEETSNILMHFITDKYLFYIKPDN